MNKNKGVWIGTVSILVIAALLVWWLMANRPISTSTGLGNVATPTGEVSTGTPNSSGAPVSVTRVSRSQQTVNQIIAGLSGTSQFNALYRTTGVSASVTTTGHYTVFVPTNGAFFQLGGLIQNMTNAEKQRLVQYHVVSGRAVDVDAEMTGMIYALSGDELNFHYGNDNIPMVNSAIVITEYTGKNGVVYLIDNVLLPPKKAQGAI